MQNICATQAQAPMSLDQAQHAIPYSQNVARQKHRTRERHVVIAYLSSTLLPVLKQ